MRAAPMPCALLLSLSLALAAPSPTHAADAAPSAWCDRLLSMAAIADAVDAPTAGLQRVATGVVAEDDRHCHRRYRIGNVPASDELIVMVTPARGAGAARAAVEGMARDASGPHYFGLSRPAGLGDAAVHYRRRDPLSERRMGLHVNFAMSGQVVEVAYHNVDDGERNKFVQASSEVESIARGIAARMTP